MKVSSAPQTKLKQYNQCRWVQLHKTKLKQYKPMKVSSAPQTKLKQYKPIEGEFSSTTLN